MGIPQIILSKTVEVVINHYSVSFNENITTHGLKKAIEVVQNKNKIGKDAETMILL